MINIIINIAKTLFEVMFYNALTTAFTLIGITSAIISKKKRT